MLIGDIQPSFVYTLTPGYVQVFWRFTAFSGAMVDMSKDPRHNAVFREITWRYAGASYLEYRKVSTTSGAWQSLNDGKTLCTLLERLAYEAGAL